ncbi:MAG: DNA-directed RNA polymerase subunit omega [Spirochaetes bacterium]|nr:MAG: DNA-directed RNA polymerase subunit omega [Spirochaetota bacterium]
MLPIYEIIDFEKNRYLLSKAVMKRARQIIFAGDEELEKFNGKIASLALKQVLHGEIKYRLLSERKR